MSIYASQSYKQSWRRWRRRKQGDNDRPPSSNNTRHCGKKGCVLWWQKGCESNIKTTSARIQRHLLRFPSSSFSQFSLSQFFLYFVLRHQISMNIIISKCHVCPLKQLRIDNGSAGGGGTPQTLLSCHVISVAKSDIICMSCAKKKATFIMQLGCNNIYSIGSGGATNSGIGEKKSLGSFGKELCVLCNFLVTFCITIFILLCKELLLW